MDAELKENELKMRKDIVKELVAMFEAAGVKNISTWDSKIMQSGREFMKWERPGWAVIQKLRFEWQQPGLGCKECFCYRWRLYDIQRLSESITYLYGPDSTRCRFCCG